MKNIVALVLCSILASTDACATEEPYLQVVRSFYKSAVALHSFGLPEARKQEDLIAFLTPGFIDELRRANDLENKCIETTPRDLKPPIWEGALFSGSNESAERAKIGTPYWAKKQPHVPVRLFVIDKSPAGKPLDTVGHVVIARLSHATGSWLISDLIYEDGQSLRSELREYSSQPCGT